MYQTYSSGLLDIQPFLISCSGSSSSCKLLNNEPDMLLISNQISLLVTHKLNSNIKMSNTFVLRVTGSTQGAYAPHKQATHVQ